VGTTSLCKIFQNSGFFNPGLVWAAKVRALLSNWVKINQRDVGYAIGKRDKLSFSTWGFWCCARGRFFIRFKWQDKWVWHYESETKSHWHLSLAFSIVTHLLFHIYVYIYKEKLFQNMLWKYADVRFRFPTAGASSGSRVRIKGEPPHPFSQKVVPSRPFKNDLTK
jgi:hypothetical protein